MSKLTKAQREVLAHCSDWSAPYEITMRRHDATGEIVSGAGTAQALGRMRNLGLVEYGPANGTYRITDSGRAALKETKLKRHECAHSGPCSDNGDGCSCSDAELALRPSPSISEGEVVTVEMLATLRKWADWIDFDLGTDRPAGTDLREIAARLEAAYKASTTTSLHNLQRTEPIEAGATTEVEVKAAAQAVLDCTHQPNPTDPKRIDVAPGKHREFGDAIRRIRSALVGGE